MDVDFEVVIKHLEQPCLICNAKSEIYNLNGACKLLFNLPDNPQKIPNLDQLIILDQQWQEEIKKIFKNKTSGNVEAFVSEEPIDNQLIALDIKISHLSELDVVPSLFLVQITKAEAREFSENTLQALGKYTGDISHAISNPLAIIKINCDTMVIKIQKNGSIDIETLTQKIDKLNDATTRITKEVEKLKKLSRDLKNVDTQTIDTICQSLESKDNGSSGDDFH